MTRKPSSSIGSTAALEPWRRLAEWAEHAPEPPPATSRSSPARRGAPRQLLGAGSADGGAEPRPQQADYASAVSHAFLPREARGHAAPRARRGRHRRRQDAGLSRAGHAVGGEERRRGVGLHLHPQPAAPDRRRARPALSRPEEDAPRRGAQGPRELPLPAEFRGGGGGAQHAAARRAGAGPDGALGAADARRRHGRRRLPGWLPELVGRGRTRGLADRRGECIHSACPHYHKCFIEKSVRRASAPTSSSPTTPW